MKKISKNVKRLFSSFLVVAVVLCSAPMSGLVGIKLPDFLTTNASAETYGDYEYAVINNTVTITGFDSSVSGEIIIPNSINGYDVTSIGYYAFSDCKRLKSVIIPDSITNIFDYAFYNCKGLINIVFSNSISYIGSAAFSGCTGLKCIELPNGVINIRDKAFEGCTGLTGITIPDSVTSIENSAFFSCTSLKSITIPNSVMSIGSLSFSDCTSLESITIGNSVTSIGEYAFDGCECLKNVKIPDSVTNIDDGIFYGCKGLTSIIIPDSVSSIGDATFGYCTGLTNVTIQDSVTSIGDSTFYNCTGLTSITIPDSITSIADSTFYNCTGLTSIVIPNGIISIGNSAFFNCEELKSITIPDSVKNIGNSAFYGCWSLKSINIPNGVTSIKESTFNNCFDLTSVSIADSVTRIENSAFSNCRGLTSVIIPDSVISIGDYAFRWCSGLKNIIIGDTVTSIGDEAFSDCTNLSSVKISDSVTSVDSFAFNKCKIKEVIITDGSKIIKEKMILGRETLEKVIIPSSITSIEFAAFAYCVKLTSITIPDSVTSIGDYAFGNCIGLTDVYFSGTRDQWQKITIGSNNDDLINAVIHCKKISLSSEDLVLRTTSNSFNGNQQAVTVNAPNGIGEITTYYEGIAPTVYSKSSTAPTNAGKYKITVDVAESDEYLSATNFYVGDFEITKAKYEYSNPTDLTATYGDYLYSVSLPTVENGRLEWDGELYNRSTTVGHPGANRFKAIFFPTDSTNYESASNIDIAVNVAQAKPSFTVPNNLTALCSQTLADVKLPSDKNGKFVWTVKSPENVVFDKRGDFKYSATYVPTSPDYFSVNEIDINVHVDCLHGNQYAKIVKAPTYTETGITEYYCSLCGELISTVVTDKLVSSINPINSVSVNDISMNYKSSAKINPTVDADEGADYTISYSSSNNKVATVDNNGNVYATGKGNATITCTVTDSSGNTVTDTCNVTVKYTVLQWIIKIVLFGWIWY